MALKTLLIHLSKAKWLREVKTQDSQIPHENNYWGTKGKCDVFLLLPKNSMHAHVEISIYGCLPESNTNTPGITVCLVHS